MSIFSTPAAPSQLDLYNGPGANWNAQVDEYGRPINTGYVAPHLTDEGESALQAYIRRKYGTHAEERLADAAYMAGARERYQRKHPSWVTSSATPAAAQGSQVGQDAAYQALQLLSPMARQSGLTNAEQQAFGQAQMQGQRAAQAGIQALAQQAAMRGMGNSGNAYAAQMGAAQQGANATLAAGTDMARGAQQRQQNAIGQMAGLGMGLDTMATGHQGAIDQFNQYATGAQGAAVQQSYQDRLAAAKQKQDQLMGYARMATSTATGGMGGGGGGG
jgi:hypothetical protein